MHFDENPFDRFCLFIFTFCIGMTLLGELFLKHFLRRISYMLSILWIQMGYHLFVLRMNTRLFFQKLSLKYIHPWLVISGLKPMPTWTDVEEYRLRLMAKSGIEIPRPPELEEGLRIEQERHSS